MSNNYRDSHKAPNKGTTYDSSFDNKHRAFLWEQEQIILDEIIEKYLIKNEFEYLDFACGTGRILSTVENRAKKSIGVDVSPSMIEVAKTKVKKAKIFQADITTDAILKDEKFDLITAYRFFPNAEDALRQDAMKAIEPLLKEDGIFVFNNHKNKYSITSLLMRIYCRIKGTHFRTMNLSEISTLTSEANLEIVEVQYTGVVLGYEWLMIMPKSWYISIESLFSKVSLFKHIALVQVIVCRRKKNS